mmetsp:Transcript_73075/g.202686  ORF Transcript_73075/g.202686 Transcript_73075/m.202686 type:complete len:215 (+) Transcript_73075:469-1113(+)
MHRITLRVHLEGLQQGLESIVVLAFGLQGLSKAFRRAAKEWAHGPHSGQVKLVGQAVLLGGLAGATHVVEAAADRAVELRDRHRVLGFVLLEFGQRFLEHWQGLVVSLLVFPCDPEVPQVLTSWLAALQVDSLLEPRLSLVILPQLVVHGAQVDERRGVWRCLAGELLEQLGGVRLPVLLAAKRGHILDALHVPRHSPAPALPDNAAVDGVGLV